MFQWGEYLSYIRPYMSVFHIQFVYTNTIFKSAVMKRFDRVNI